MSRRFMLTLVLSLAAVVFMAQTSVQAGSPLRFPIMKPIGSGSRLDPGLGSQGGGGTVQIVIVIVIVTNQQGQVVDRVPFSGQTREEAKGKALDWIETQKSGRKGAKYNYMIR